MSKKKDHDKGKAKDKDKDDKEKRDKSEDKDDKEKRDKSKDKHHKDKHEGHKHDSDKHGHAKHDGGKHGDSKHDSGKHKGDKHKDEKHKDEKHKDEKHKAKHEKALFALDKHLKGKLKEDLAEPDEPEEDEAEAALEEEEGEEKEQLHPLETVTNLLLIRHGHTEATEQGLLYCDAKMPMTAKGEEQAKNAAQWAVDFRPDVIVTGTAVRVAQSAVPLAELTGLTPVVVKGFEEWNVGEWEGRTYLDIKKNSPKEYEAWSRDPVNNAPPGGESIDDLVQRIGRSLRHLILNKDFHGKRIAMVTHSGIIRSIIVQSLDMPVSNFWRIAIPTGSVSRVNFSTNFATLQFSGVVPGARP